MEIQFSNIIPTNKYIILSDGIEQFILVGINTSRKTIKQILKKYAPV